MDNQNNTQFNNSNVPNNAGQSNPFGIIGIVLWWFGFSPVGLVLGIIGLKKSRQMNGIGRVSSIVAIVLNAIALAAIVIFLVIFIIMIAAGIGFAVRA